MEFITQPRSPL